MTLERLYEMANESHVHMAREKENGHTMIQALDMVMSRYGWDPDIDIIEEDYKRDRVSYVKKMVVWECGDAVEFCLDIMPYNGETYQTMINTTPYGLLLSYVNKF